MALGIYRNLAILLLAASSPAVHAGDQDWARNRHDRFAARDQSAAMKTGATVWDGPDFPEMIVVPHGHFTMGSPPQEANRHSDEGIAHSVTIAYDFAVGKYPVTVGEFARFIRATHYDAGSTCKTFEGGTWDDHRPGRNWRNPGFAQSADDPVVCMNLADAQAYAAWLSRVTHHAYRLLSEAEYEYVNRAGTTTPWWWGNDIAANRANCLSCGNPALHDGTVPGGRFAPNGFGLYDTTGNAWSWVADCWQDGYDGAPTDGSAFRGGDCTQHVERGGAWFYIPGSLRSAIRAKDPNGLRNYHNGFRVARTL